MSSSTNKKILIFAGTNEGRRLCEYLTDQGIAVTACVATEYGSLCLSAMTGLDIREGRLSAMEIEELIKHYDIILDATHPYAKLISENLKSACEVNEKPYIRVIRPQTEYSNVITCDSIEAACEYLNQTEGKVLITTGSKELKPYTTVADYKERLYLRVLPSIDALEECNRKGFKASNIICMQGPFSEELNLAMLKQVKASYLVTKESGKAGGFEEKLSAAEKCGVKVIVIGRPVKEEGFSLQETMGLLKQELSIREEINPSFPMFLKLEKKKITVIGAGKIAARRIKSLLKFSADITVIAPDVSEELSELADRITIRLKEFEESDIFNSFIVIAATDNRNVNQKVYEAAQRYQILVNVADQKEQSDFYFPALFMDEDIIGGIISKNGENHSLVKQRAELIREFLNRNERK